MLRSKSLFGVIWYATDGVRHKLAEKFGEWYELNGQYFGDDNGCITVVAGDSPVTLHNASGGGVPPRTTAKMRLIMSPDVGRVSHTFAQV